MSSEALSPKAGREPAETSTGTGNAAASSVGMPVCVPDEVLHLPCVGVREKALPIRPSELTRMLMDQPGLTSEERRLLGLFGRLLGATFHQEFYDRLRELKERYAALDPDSDYCRLPGYALPAGPHASEEFLKVFESTLARANYHVLSNDIVKAAIEAPNELGLNYVPDLSQFEQMRIYVRGFTQITREARSLKTRFRKRTVTLDAYQRLIVALKFKEGVKKAGPLIRTDTLYLRMFKNVPHVDMEMHLPEQGTKVRMRMVDKAQIASPLVVGIPTMIFKAIGFLTVGGIAGMAGLLAAPISASVNSFFGFQRAKQKHMTHMIRSLYYLTLANNNSVLTRLTDSAEEEEYKETLLSYFFLWRSEREEDEGLRRKALDKRIEEFLLEATGVEVDFEVDDALRKLYRLGLAHRDPSGQIRAKPIAEALAHLDRLWDSQFRYAMPRPKADPGLDET